MSNLFNKYIKYKNKYINLKYSIIQKGANGNKLKSLCFTAIGINNTYNATYGDKKPIILLGLYVSLLNFDLYSTLDMIEPVYIYVPSKGFDFIDKYIIYILETKYKFLDIEKNKLITKNIETKGSNIIIKYNMREDVDRDYIHFLTIIKSDEYLSINHSDNMITFAPIVENKCEAKVPCKDWVYVDFGDNSGFINRFALKLLDYDTSSTYEIGQKHYARFPPLVLPMDKIAPWWSSDIMNINAIDTFIQLQRKNQKYILLLCTANYNRLTLAQIYKILDECKDWAFIIIKGGKNLGDEEKHDRCKISEYIEYEDVGRLDIDLIITSGGAGSVTFPILAGIPQICWISGVMVSGDKKYNLIKINSLKIGPPSKAMNYNIQDNLVSELEIFIKNKEEYKQNALTLKQNTRFNMKNIDKSFVDILIDRKVQDELIGKDKEPYERFIK